MSLFGKILPRKTGLTPGLLWSSFEFFHRFIVAAAKNPSARFIRNTSRMPSASDKQRGALHLGAILLLSGFPGPGFRHWNRLSG
jgi:hypothetical protein